MSKPFYTRRVHVQPVKVTAFCRECGMDGEMRPTPNVFTTHPLGYEHKCMRCKALAVLDARYPHLDYDAIPADDAADKGTT